MARDIEIGCYKHLKNDLYGKEVAKFLVNAIYKLRFLSKVKYV